MTNPLPPLVYGKVVGRLLAGIVDSPDIGELPDFPPLTGRVIFTADVPKFLVQSADPPATVKPLTAEHFTVTLDDEGYLTWRGVRGVRLPAPVAGTMNPDSWTWRVSFELSYLGTPVQMATFSIDVPEYTPGPNPGDPDDGSVGLVDLSMVSPVPASGGNAVVRGVSVDSVGLTGNDLIFGLDDGSFLPGVTVPAIQDADDDAAAAAASAAAAATSATDAQNAVNSFDLAIGTVTTGATGTPAAASVFGGPPAWTMDLTLPEGPVGPAAPDADATTKGILQLAGDLGGTATSPTVPGLSGKANTVHTHTATDITDSTAVGRDVLTAATQAAGRTAIGAGTSSLVLGTTTGTACEGDDARLSDARTPTAAGQVYDFAFMHTSGQRQTGGGNVAPMGIKLRRDVRLTEVTYRGTTADGSGNLSVELRSNGAQIVGTNLVIAAADQTAGGVNATTTGTWDLSAGDVLVPYITGVGTTPGDGLIADIKGETR